MTDKVKQTVPLTSLIEERKKHSVKVVELEGTISQLQSQISEMKATIETSGLINIQSDDREELNVKQKLIDIQKKLQDERKRFEEERTGFNKEKSTLSETKAEIEAKERLERLKTKATELGIDAEELKNSVEAGEGEDSAALRLVREKATQTQGQFDRTMSNSLSTKPVYEMSKDEFKAHIEKQRREALKK